MASTCSVLPVSEDYASSSTSSVNPILLDDNVDIKRRNAVDIEISHQEYIDMLVNILRGCPEDAEYYQEAKLAVELLTQDPIVPNEDLNDTLNNLAMLPILRDIIYHVRNGLKLGVDSNEECIRRMKELNREFLRLPEEREVALRPRTSHEPRRSNLGTNKPGYKSIKRLIEYLSSDGAKVSRADIVDYMNLALKTDRPLYYLECSRYILNLIDASGDE